jgi:hypothetical protein
MTTSTVVALFDDYNDAHSAVRELEGAGIPSSNISLVANNAANRYGTYHNYSLERRNERAEESAAGPGAAIGAVVGGGVGLLTGIGAMAIPGVGPVVAAGVLVATLAGAVVGAAAGGLVGALVRMGVPREHADIYAEAVRRGGTLVTVQMDDTWHQRVTDILNRHAPVDIEERVASWRKAGWQRFDETAGPYTGPLSGPAAMTGTPPVDRPLSTETAREMRPAGGTTSVGTADTDWEVRRNPDLPSDADRPNRVRVYPPVEEHVSERR